ncbi:hypothetical protein, partial [uncultured Thermomonospora sp.]|uniref:hypothetical protein n=1 Tax=uncultured Thermomonospora sp. TaxID=671175 RepID=UPI00259B1FC8
RSSIIRRMQTDSSALSDTLSTTSGLSTVTVICLSQLGFRILFFLGAGPVPFLAAPAVIRLKPERRFPPAGL